MMVLLIAIAVMLLAISFLCGYLVGAKCNENVLYIDGDTDTLDDAIKETLKWIDEQNNESGDADR